MNNKKTAALGIIDAQRGFMPAHEGERLGLGGFGELPVPDGETIVPALNKLLLSDVCPDFVFTTQDWHPIDTAHFSEEPNFTTTWPVHCVASTLGARIHPLVELPENVVQYKKGQEKLVDGKDDTSYSGWNATRTESHMYRGGLETFDNTLVRSDKWREFTTREPEGTTIYLGGLALDYCVKATAIDIFENTGLDVVILTDATKPVAEETGQLAIEQMMELGIRFITVDEAIAELREG